MNDSCQSLGTGGNGESVLRVQSLCPEDGKRAGKGCGGDCAMSLY